MTWLVPAGLLALLTLPVIVLLHLLGRRRVRQRVPSLEIWNSLQPAAPPRTPRLQLVTPLLLLHLLLATLLGIALGQPLLPWLWTQPSHLAIIVDTSTSMTARDGQPDRLTSAKLAAHDLLVDLRRGESVALIALTTAPTVVAQTTDNDSAALRDQLDQLQAGGPDGALDQALLLAQATTPAPANTRMVVLTDTAFGGAATQPVAGTVEWRTFGGEGDNTAITAFGAQPLPNGGHQLYARVANYGTTPVTRTLDLTLDEQPLTSEPVRLEPDGQVEWSWPLPDGAQRAAATLDGTDLQPLDDRATAQLTSPASQRVLVVGRDTATLERALRAQPQLLVETTAPINYAPRAGIDLHVFVNYVPPALPATPVLLVAPPAEQSLLGVGEPRVASPAEQIQVVDTRFGTLDWRSLVFERVAQLDVPDWATVAVTTGDTPLILTGQRDGQPVLVWAFNPDDTNLSNRIQFPLLTATSLQVLQPNMPELANAPDAGEAQLRARPAPQITTISQPTGDAGPVGNNLWQILVAGALVLLVVEALYVIRRYNTSFTKQQGK